jgi:hypothetical protein
MGDFFAGWPQIRSLAIAARWADVANLGHVGSQRRRTKDDSSFTRCFVDLRPGPRIHPLGASPEPPSKIESLRSLIASAKPHPRTGALVLALGD